MTSNLTVGRRRGSSVRRLVHSRSGCVPRGCSVVCPFPARVRCCVFVLIAFDRWLKPPRPMVFVNSVWWQHKTQRRTLQLSFLLFSLAENLRGWFGAKAVRRARTWLGWVGGLVSSVSRPASLCLGSSTCHTGSAT